MRKDGFYWLKMAWGEWTIHKWVDNKWDFPYTEYDHSVYMIVEIDERQIVREKPKMSKEQITKAEELISDTIRKVDKLFGLL